jgi:hypothetical protein
MCPLDWRLIVVSMGSVWREKTVDLGVQSNETFGNDSNIVARAFGGDIELMPHVFAHLTHFYPKSGFYPINLRVDAVNLRVDAVNPRAKPCLDTINLRVDAVNLRVDAVNLRVHAVNPRAKPCLDAINLRVDAAYADVKGIDTATKSIFEMPQIGPKGFDCFRCFDVHR